MQNYYRKRVNPQLKKILGIETFKISLNEIEEKHIGTVKYYIDYHLNPVVYKIITTNNSENVTKKDINNILVKLKQEAIIGLYPQLNIMV